METLHIQHQAPWLFVELPDEHALLSWALWRGGAVQARQVAWLQVREADLGPEVDAQQLLSEGLWQQGWPEAVGLMTACEVAHYQYQCVTVEGVHAECVLTLGLSNATRIGQAPPPVLRAQEHGYQPDTINCLVRVSSTLSALAQLEALSLITQARTAALLATPWEHPHGSHGPVTGTGTDCIVLASALGAPPQPYAGLYTAVGQAIGQAVYQATAQAMHAWLARYITKEACK